MKAETHGGRIFDAVVYGDSCSAFGAAAALRQTGQSVLLISRHTGLVREASWSFLQSAQVGASKCWRDFQKYLQERRAWQSGRIDGGCAEVVAAEYGQLLGVNFLFYAAPFAWEENDGLVTRMGFWAKEGEVWIGARRWVDASVTGELARIWRPGLPVPHPVRREAALFFRHPAAVSPARVEWTKPVEGVIGATYEASLWENESVLRFATDRAYPREVTLALLAHARKSLDLAGAVVSHGSFVAAEIFDPADVPDGLPSNTVLAATAFLGGGADVGSLSDAGVLAGKMLLEVPSARGRAGNLVEIPQPKSSSYDVVVAGLGTGGTIAALSAARQGVRVAAVELMPVPGGVGTGGGIHLYYFGVEGGLQRELDRRTSECMPLFGQRKNVAGFHPMAKTLVIEGMLREQGVEVWRETMIGPVMQTQSGRVDAVQISAPEGLRRLRAEAWVDSTGDADLAVRAGAPFQGSGRSDGLPSAFSQASGRFRWRDGELFLRILNFDAGFVDATQSEDLSRSRLMGLRHYRSGCFTAEEHPTYIAPLLGVRQSRHIEAEYLVTLADLVERRTFPDAISYTACHFDSHAIDFEFESDESAFWIWGCRNWRTRTACEIPYRALLPVGLDNVLLGCRAVGATPDAHQSFRMQRDMQRIGEVAGLAAAFVARFGSKAGEVPLNWLREQLESTGGLKAGAKSNDGFGYHVDASSFSLPTEKLNELVEKTRHGFGPHMFLLYLAGEAAVLPLRDMLAEPEASWRAAVILAMRRDAAAEFRLLQAIKNREIGFATDDPRRPELCQRLAPNWISALVFLRHCASPACLEPLSRLASDPSLVHNARTATALLCASLAENSELTGSERRQAIAIVRLLVATDAPNAIGHPQRTVVGWRPPQEPEEVWYPDVIEDFRWQLHLAVAKALLALGGEPHPEALAFLDDARAAVRQAFASLPATAAPTQIPEAAAL